jgi:hypothetical protein
VPLRKSIFSPTYETCLRQMADELPNPISTSSPPKLTCVNNIRMTATSQRKSVSIVATNGPVPAEAV